MTRNKAKAVGIVGIVCVLAGSVLFVALNIAVQAVHNDVLSAHRGSHDNAEAEAEYHRLQGHEYDVARRGSILSMFVFGTGLACLAASVMIDRRKDNS
jgi:hypothetical protein